MDLLVDGMDIGHAGGDNGCVQAVTVKNIGVAAASGHNLLNIHGNGFCRSLDLADHPAIRRKPHQREVQVDIKVYRRSAPDHTGRIVPVCNGFGKYFFYLLRQCGKFFLTMTSHLTFNGNSFRDDI